MTLQDILNSVREFLEEPVTIVEAQNVAENFENHTAAAVPGLPWVTVGANGPKVQSQGGQNQLKIQYSGAGGSAHLCGIDINTQIATDSIPVVVEFDLYRAVDGAAVVNICGINNNAALTSTFAFQLLRLSAADPGVLEYNDVNGWASTSRQILPATTYVVTLWLYKEWFSLFLNGEGVATTKKYPGYFVASSGTFGYLYFYSNDHATYNCFINDLTSNGKPTVFGESTWSNEELSHYANEAVAWLRGILPPSVFEKYILESTQTTTGSTANYALPVSMQRFIAASYNGKNVSLIGVADHVAIKNYLSNHYIGAGLENFPTGWIMDGDIYLCPAPSGSNSLKIYYLPAVNEMDIVQPSNTEPEIPEDLHKAVVWYTIVRAREKTGDDTSGPRSELESMIVGTGSKAQLNKAM